MYEDNDSQFLAIDVTPMAIVAMLLTIIFMSTATTWLQPLMKVDLPQAHTQESEPLQNTTISIGVNGEIAIDDMGITWEKLYVSLLVMMNKDKNVIIRADRKATYGQIIEAMHIAKKAGAKHISIATEQKKQKK